MINLTDTPPPPGFLTKAERAAERVWLECIQRASPNYQMSASLIRAFRDPWLRHFAELYLNDCVTLRGAYVLRSMGYAEFVPVTEFVELTGRPAIHVVIPTQTGLDAYQARLGRARSEWPSYFTREIGLYAARDNGEGICLGPDHLRTAIAQSDSEILVSFIDPVEPKGPVWDFTTCRRLFAGGRKRPRHEDAAEWAPRGPERSEAPVQVSLGEEQSAIWLDQGRAHLTDYFDRKMRGKPQL